MFAVVFSFGVIIFVFGSDFFPSFNAIINQQAQTERYEIRQQTERNFNLDRFLGKD
jgi:hypothetical protein